MVWVISSTSRDRQKYTVKVDSSEMPEQVIAAAIRKRMRTRQMSVQQQDQCVETYTPTYVLKVCGCKQFILANYPIGQYKVC